MLPSTSTPRLSTAPEAHMISTHARPARSPNPRPRAQTTSGFSSSPTAVVLALALMSSWGCSEANGSGFGATTPNDAGASLDDASPNADAAPDSNASPSDAAGEADPTPDASVDAEADVVAEAGVDATADTGVTADTGTATDSGADATSATWDWSDPPSGETAVKPAVPRSPSRTRFDS